MSKWLPVYRSSVTGRWLDNRSNVDQRAGWLHSGTSKPSNSVLSSGKTRYSSNNDTDWLYIKDSESVANALADLNSIEKPVTSSPDIVNNPPHYTRLTPQPIDVVEAWELPHFPASAVSYIARAGHKTGTDAETDYRKAIWYLEREIARLNKVAE